MRLKKQPVGSYDPWNFDLESGSRVYKRTEGDEYLIYDLLTSTGVNKRDRGELTPKLVKNKDGTPKMAVKKKDGFYWT